MLEIQILVRTAQILDLKALNFDLFHQTLVKRVKCIQHIDEVMLCFMGRGIIECKQRIEVFQRLLRHLAAHLLRLVQNQNRTVRLDNVDRSAGAELVALRIDNTALFILCALFQRRRKRLRIDDHHVDAGVAGKRIKLIEVRAVVDEVPRLLAVMLHKVVFCHLKRLLDALADGDRRHHYDELRPTVTLVQLKHCLDVDVSLAGTGLHLNIQTAPAEILHKRARLLDIVLLLNPADI